MAIPATVITSAERGTPLDLPGIASRLTEVARIAYGEAGLLHLPLGSTGPPFELQFSAVLSRVYPTSSPETSGRLYLADLRPFDSALEYAGLRWLDRALDSNRRTLDRLQNRIFAPEALAGLRRAAERYFQIFDALPEKRVLGSLGHGAISFEPPQVREERERTAIGLADDDLLKILGGHPRRLSIFRSLSRGQEESRGMLEGIFLDARNGVARFGVSIRAEPARLWNFPPIVIAALGELGLLGSRVVEQTLLARFTLDYARVRSPDLWGQISPVAGIAVLVAAMAVEGGLVGLALSLIDFGIAGKSAFDAWQRAHENAMAEAASALSEGRLFTDEVTNYGDPVLAGAAALLSGAQAVAAGVRLYREAKAAGAAVETVVSGEAGRVDPSSPASESLPHRGYHASDEGRELQRGVPGSIAEVKQPMARERLGELESPIDRGRSVNASDRAIELPPERGPLQLETPLESLGQPPASSGEEVGKVRRISGLESSPERNWPREVGEATMRRRTRELQLSRLQALQDSGVLEQEAELTGRVGGRRVTSEEQLYGIPLDWDATVRAKTPTDQLRQWAQQRLPINAPDPAFPGRLVAELAQADHIVPVDYIRGMPGFAQLDTADQLKVLNLPPNFEPLSGLANRSKNNRLPSEWFGHKGLDLAVDESYLKTLIAKERRLIPFLQDKINELLRLQLAR
jgi:hypothetical protein